MKPKVKLESFKLSWIFGIYNIITLRLHHRCMAALCILLSMVASLFLHTQTPYQVMKKSESEIYEKNIYILKKDQNW